MTRPVPPPASLIPFLTPDTERLWREADVFATDHIAPRITRMENARGADHKVAALLARLRWFGVTIGTEHGGMGAGSVARTVLIHRLARVSGAAGAILQASLIPVAALDRYGTDEQRTRLLPQIAEGSLLPTIAVTEPSRGGHLGGIETVAERRGTGWVIRGSKAHVGNVAIGGLHLVVARTAPKGVRTSEALTAFLVEGDRRGVAVRPHRRQLGLRGFSAGRLDLRVEVTQDHVLGEVGNGAAVAQHASTTAGRPNITALSLGLHEALLETTRGFLTTRPRYGGTLTDLPVLRDRIGGMRARLHAARVLAYQAAHLQDLGLPCTDDLMAAKLLGHQWALESGRDAMELHGATGLDEEGLVARLWRDVQHTYAPAGTGEVQRLRLAQNLFDESPEEAPAPTEETSPPPPVSAAAPA